MLVLRDHDDVACAAHPESRLLLQQRVTMLGRDEPYDPDVCGYFVVLESRDDLIGLNGQLGLDILANRFNGTHFGPSESVPAWEILDEHTS